MPPYNQLIYSNIITFLASVVASAHPGILGSKKEQKKYPLTEARERYGLKEVSPMGVFLFLYKPAKRQSLSKLAERTDVHLDSKKYII